MISHIEKKPSPWNTYETDGATRGDEYFTMITWGENFGGDTGYRDQNPPWPALRH